MSLYSQFKSVVAVDDTQSVGILLSGEVVRCFMGEDEVIIDTQKDLSRPYYQAAVTEATKLSQQYQGKALIQPCSW